MIEIDDRVTIRDEHDAIAACCGYDPADYESVEVRRYTIETATMGFLFCVDEAGVLTSVSEPKLLVAAVDIV